MIEMLCCYWLEVRVVYLFTLFCCWLFAKLSSPSSAMFLLGETVYTALQTVQSNGTVVVFSWSVQCASLTFLINYLLTYLLTYLIYSRQYFISTPVVFSHYMFQWLCFEGSTTSSRRRYCAVWWFSQTWNATGSVPPSHQSQRRRCCRYSVHRWCWNGNSSEQFQSTILTYWFLSGEHRSVGFNHGMWYFVSWQLQLLFLWCTAIFTTSLFFCWCSIITVYQSGGIHYLWHHQ